MREQNDPPIETRLCQLLRRSTVVAPRSPRAFEDVENVVAHARVPAPVRGWGAVRNSGSAAVTVVGESRADRSLPGRGRPPDHHEIPDRDSGSSERLDLVRATCHLLHGYGEAIALRRFAGHAAQEVAIALARDRRVVPRQRPRGIAKLEGSVASAALVE